MNGKVLIFGIIGILCLVGLTVGSAVGANSNDNLQFRNAYLSFTYPDGWTVVDNSTGLGNVQILMNSSDGTGQVNLSTVTAQYVQSSNYNLQNNTVNGYNIKNYTLANNNAGGNSYIGAFIWAGNNIYQLQVTSSNPNLPQSDITCYNTIINSIKFANGGNNIFNIISSWWNQLTNNTGNNTTNTTNNTSNTGNNTTLIGNNTNGNNIVNVIISVPNAVYNFIVKIIITIEYGIQGNNSNQTINSTNMTNITNNTNVSTGSAGNQQTQSTQNSNSNSNQTTG
jgi:hypothetical protein